MRITFNDAERLAANEMPADCATDRLRSGLVRAIANEDVVRIFKFVRRMMVATKHDLRVRMLIGEVTKCV